MEKNPYSKKEKNPKLAMLTMLLAFLAPGDKAEANNSGDFSQDQVERIQEMISDDEVDAVEEGELKDMIKEKFEVILKLRADQLNNLIEKIDEIYSDISSGAENVEDLEEKFTDGYFKYQNSLYRFRDEGKIIEKQIGLLGQLNEDYSLFGDVELERLKDDYDSLQEEINKNLDRIDRVFVDLVPILVNDNDMREYLVKVENLFPDAFNEIAGSLDLGGSDKMRQIARDTRSQDDFERSLSYLPPEEKLEMMKDMNAVNVVTNSGFFSRFSMPVNILGMDLFFINARESKYIKDKTINEMEANSGLLTKIFDELVKRHLINRDSI